MSALNNGIDGMAWGRLNLICEKLQISPVDLEPIGMDLDEKTQEQKRLLAYYELLNEEGKMKAESYLKDISMIPVYHRER